MYLSSAMDQLSRLGRDADLLALAHLEADAGRRPGLRIGDCDLRHVQRRFLALDPALRALLRRLAVTRMDVDARHNHLAVLRNRLDDLAGTTHVLAGQDHDHVTLLD